MMVPTKSTELDQRVPVAAVAGQPRGLDRKYGADAAFTDRRQQALEARPIDAAARAAEIIVDDLDRGPAELPGTIGKSVLPAAALLIVQELIGRRLADVDEGAAAQMVSRDLASSPISPPASAAAISTQQGFDQRCQLLLLRGDRHGARLVLLEQVLLRISGLALLCASLLAFSIPESDWRKPRSASISARRDRRISSENHGSHAQLVMRAADSCVIHAGMQATDPSGCGMTTRLDAPIGIVPEISTVSPHRGWNWIVDPALDRVLAGSMSLLRADTWMTRMSMPLLQQMGGEAVPQRMRRDPLADLRGLGGEMNHAIELARRDRIDRVPARKQPALRPCDQPPLAQQLSSCGDSMA